MILPKRNDGFKNVGNRVAAAIGQFDGKISTAK